MQFIKRLKAIFNGFGSQKSPETLPQVAKKLIASPDQSSKEEGASTERKLLLEPNWSICRVGSKRIGPKDVRHVDHALWKRWRKDISLDSLEDAVRRAQGELLARSQAPAIVEPVEIATPNPDVAGANESIEALEFEPAQSEIEKPAPQAEDPDAIAKKLEEQRLRRERYVLQQQDAENKRIRDQRINDEAKARQVLADQRLRQEAAVAQLNGNDVFGNDQDIEKIMSSGQPFARFHENEAEPVCYPTDMSSGQEESHRQSYQ
jgi:hypothetical protein